MTESADDGDCTAQVSVSSCSTANESETAKYDNIMAASADFLSTMLNIPKPDVSV